MRVLLVDDELLALDRLKALIAQIEGVEVVGEAGDGEQALRAIEKLRPDLVMLDMQMPGLNGLRTAAAIDVDPRPEIIFVTAHEHYAPDAFEVDAADYLLKPVRFERLRQALERARRRRSMRDEAERAGLLEVEIRELRSAAPKGGSDAAFWVPGSRGQTTRVALQDIDWIEAAKDYVLLHTPVRSHLLRITMAALEEKLAGGPLVRVHRSAFVCPDRVVAVQRVKRTLVLTLADGVTVKVGPNYVDRVEAALAFSRAAPAPAPAAA